MVLITVVVVAAQVIVVVPATAAAAAIEEGVVVVCVGLVNAAEHNGTRAAVVSKEPCAESGRYTVQRLDTGVKLRLKPENMRLLLIPKGTVVEIFGLQNATEHNGQHGEVVGQSGKGTIAPPSRKNFCIGRAGKTSAL